MVKGGIYGKWGHMWQRGGACVAKGGGMHGMHGPPLLRDTASQCAGGTRPTGMHSCFLHGNPFQIVNQQNFMCNTGKIELEELKR